MGEEEQPPGVRHAGCAQDDTVECGCPCCVPFGPLLPAFPHIPSGPFSCLSCRYVYDHIGGEHSEVIPELGATVATFAITTLWLGPCDIVYLWSFLNCFGLNFELWVQKLAEWGPLAQIEVSGRRSGAGVGWITAEGGTTALTFGPQSRTFSTQRPCCQGNGSPCRYLAPPSVGCGYLGQAVLVRPSHLSGTQYSHL